MTSFWSYWVSIIILGSVFGSLWLLWATRKSETSKTETEKTMGHTFDGIEEYDNPMPKWWLHLFVATCIYGIGYYIVYPGLGNYQGLFGWSSTGQWEEEVAEAEAKYNQRRRKSSRYRPKPKPKPNPGSRKPEPRPAEAQVPGSDVGELIRESAWR